jgi:hypothetical protein
MRSFYEFCLDLAEISFRTRPESCFDDISVVPPMLTEPLLGEDALPNVRIAVLG